MDELCLNDKKQIINSIWMWLQETIDKNQCFMSKMYERNSIFDHPSNSQKSMNRRSRSENRPKSNWEDLITIGVSFGWLAQEQRLSCLSCVLPVFLSQFLRHPMQFEFSKCIWLWKTIIAVCCDVVNIYIIYHDEPSY